MKTQKTVYATEYQLPNIGDELILVHRENILTGLDEWILRDAPEGIGGNLDNSQKRFHGWCGTTNDISVTAHGLRKVIAIKKAPKSKWTDENETTYAVTVGPDLYPDRD